MRNDVAELISDALGQPENAVMYRLSRQLAETFPDRYVLETSHWAFDVEQFAADGRCELEISSRIHSQLDTDPDEKFASTTRDKYNAWFSVKWEGNEFEVVSIGIRGIHCRDERQFVVSQTPECAEEFLLAVCDWNAEIRGEVLVYSDGWDKDADLFEAIKGSTLDNLVLEEGLKEQIQRDFETFFRSRESYERYGVPWKRGVLLLGPPGNGKTHCIKALVNLLGLPCLYVRTFERQYGTQQSAISEVFKRTRQAAPCVLVLEDLDSLVTDENRSFFLNELDGFASNTGIMVVATTNHPERLDPAILERPSRFDRKYTFHLPDESVRENYLLAFSLGLESEFRLTKAGARQLAAVTEGFSFAYLKELFLSAMMDWIHGTEQPILAVMLAQVETLREQMQTPEEEAPPFAAPDMSEMTTYMERWRRMR